MVVERAGPGPCCPARFECTAVSLLFRLPSLFPPAALQPSTANLQPIGNTQLSTNDLLCISLN